MLLATALQSILNITDTPEHVAMLTNAEQQTLAHRRAAHFSHGILRRTPELTRGFTYPYRHHPQFCDSCPSGNSKYPTLKTPRTRASQPLELVHTDLWGKTQCKSINGNSYAICFQDDFSKHIAVYFLKRKSDAASALLKYIDQHSTPLQIRIRHIQSDFGGEFQGEWANICRINGIIQRFSSPDLQAQNSCAERTWQTLTNTTLRLLQDAQLPAKYYEDAMTTAAWVKNRIYSTAVDGMTPHEAMWSEKPDLSLLRVWGSPAYVHIPKHKVVKLNDDVATRRRKRLVARGDDRAPCTKGKIEMDYLGQYQA